MNRKVNSFHRPYEIIETEETVTRYFDPSHSKVLINSTDNNCQTNPQCCRKSGPTQEQHDPKITRNDAHLQALHEKFNKLRTIMAEVSEKFKEINSASLSKFSTFDDVLPTAEVADFSLNSCEKKKLQENLDGEDLSSRGASLVSIDARSDHHESPAFPNRFIRETDCALNKNSNDVDASLLNRSKNLLINLIDNELQRLQSSQKTSFPDQSNPEPHGDSRLLKMECIDRIAEELAVLKGLEVIEGADHVQ